MDLSLNLRFQPAELSFFNRDRRSPFISPLKLHLPTWDPLKYNLKRTVSVTAAKINTEKRVHIEGVSEKLNLIASQNLDFAPARRRVRSAFTEVQQNLDHCLFKWYERNSKGLEIFCKSWMPKPGLQIKGSLFFCHGYGDTCTFFFEGIARYIAAAGYVIYALDHPGFGLSEGLHGYVPSFDALVDNVIEIYTKIKGRPEVRRLPHFILGQSMGGAVTLKVHLKEPREWDGVILVAPMCKIAEDVVPPPAVLKGLTLLSKVMPKAKLVPQQDLSELAFRDLRKRKMAVYNVICYSDRTRIKTGLELLTATKEIEKRLDEVSSPLLILHGLADKVTDPSVSRFLYEKASSMDKTLKLYKEGYHCILEGEPDDRIYTVLGDIISWLDARC
ncbi:caffeoylshikimate esterase isoform X2 [Mangifera indica]|uniref:caffeoylshikimate esterase isoform X2 n=1 Tax=Mangifera indica TaxID=29780 RepID=UPI001CFB72D2|nr:caffeoylshikimate esterase isoform X2 [Mangifera indica]